jgi:hypothetical protein
MDTICEMKWRFWKLDTRFPRVVLSLRYLVRYKREKPHFSKFVCKTLTICSIETAIGYNSSRTYCSWHSKC